MISLRCFPGLLNWTRNTILLSAVALTGCADRAEIHLSQSAAPVAEQDMRLRADEAFFATRDDANNYLIAMPAPRAVGPTRDFLIFITLPNAAMRGRFEPNEGSARGFLIQTVGLRAGRSNFVQGEVAISTSWRTPGKRRIEINAQCSDGTHVFGHAFAVPSTTELNSFIRHHQGDIELIAPKSPATAPASMPGFDAERDGAADPPSQNP